jgi:hypothetical protein
MEFFSKFLFLTSAIDDINQVLQLESYSANYETHTGRNFIRARRVNVHIR